MRRYAPLDGVAIRSALGIAVAAWQLACAPVIGMQAGQGGAAARDGRTALVAVRTSGPPGPSLDAASRPDSASVLIAPVAREPNRENGQAATPVAETGIAVVGVALGTVVLVGMIIAFASLVRHLH